MLLGHVEGNAWKCRSCMYDKNEVRDKRFGTQIPQVAAEVISSECVHVWDRGHGLIPGKYQHLMVGEGAH